MQRYISAKLHEARGWKDGLKGWWTQASRCERGRKRKPTTTAARKKKGKKKAWLRRANTRGNTAQHTTDGSVNSPRGGLNARPLLLGEAGDGAVAVVASKQGFLRAHLGVASVGDGGWGDGAHGFAQQPPANLVGRTTTSSSSSSSQTRRRVAGEEGLRLGGAYLLRHRRHTACVLSPAARASSFRSERCDARFSSSSS